jgi:hypothetical protein
MHAASPRRCDRTNVSQDFIVTVSVWTAYPVLSQSASNQRRWYHEGDFFKRLSHNMISFKG